MSALPPKADMRSGAQNVRLVPIADIQASLAAYLNETGESKKNKDAGQLRPASLTRHCVRGDGHARGDGHSKEGYRSVANLLA